MSGGKIAAVIFFILLLVWLLLLILGNLGLMEGSTQKYIKDRKWDKMKEMLKKLYNADGTKDTTVCSKIRDWWEDNKKDYNDFIADQEDGDPETLNDWSLGFPAEIEFSDFVDEYFDDIGEELAESNFLEIAKGISLCEDEVDVSELKANVVRIIEDPVPPGYDALAGDCSNVTTEETILPNYVWSYDDDTFIDISGIKDTGIGSTDWRNKVKMVCEPLAMDEEYVPAGSDSSGAPTLPKIKFTNVTNPITGTKIEVFEEGTGGLTTNLSYTFTSSNITSFEIDIGTTNTFNQPIGYVPIVFNKPLYTIKLNDKETDHIFAGNVGTISFGETAAIGTEGTDGYVAPTPKYDEIKFTPNIDIGSTGAKYDIILEADTFPKPATVGAAAVHSCTVGSKTVAKIVATAFTKGSPVSFIQEQCYSTSPSTDYGADIDFVAAKYTAYIRKAKTSTIATLPENPKYKFATLTRAAAAVPSSLT
jgi:hypothetical protein